MKHIFTFCIILLLATSAHAVRITTDTTPAQDQGAIFKCTKNTSPVDGNGDPRDCTGAEAKAFVEAAFIEYLDGAAREYRESAERGINKDFLHRVAREPSLSLSTKCAVMEDEGVKAKYETLYGVTCP